MSGFVRTFVQFPGFSVLSNIESVNIIDTPPPSTPLGAGVGVVCVVGEFEAGPLETPTRVFGGQDLEANFGGFGHTKDGVPYMYPAAAQSGESSFPWNGSGFIQLRNKKFAGLVICRVDNSAGSVVFNRLASLTGGQAPFNLEPGEHIDISVDGAAAVVGTFNAAAASITGVGGTFPTVFVGGETLELSLDGAPTRVVTFTAADQTNAQVRDRINASMAATVADLSGGQIRLSSVQRGWGGSIEIVGGSARATLGLPTTTTAQVATLTVTAASNSVTWTASITRTISGVATVYTASYLSDGSATDTEIKDGLLASFQSLGVPGVTFISTGAATMTATADANEIFTAPTITPGGAGTGTFTTTTPAVLTHAIGTGNVENIDSVTQAEFASIVGALTGVDADADEDGNARIMATTTPATGSIEVVAATTATGLGFTEGESASAGTGGVEGTIPAGTLLHDATGDTLWITLEDTDVDEDDGGPYSVKVRPAVDDDTTPTAAAGSTWAVQDTLFTPFVVTNVGAALSRLSGAQMAARYQQAIDATIDSNSDATFSINQIVPLRSHATIMDAAGDNADEATASGHRARKTVVSPPIGTTRSTAMSSAGVGVGAVGRRERVMYCFPNFTTVIPEIALRGTAGGTGFTADGVVEVLSSVFYASVRSILNPEENAGQQLSTTNYGPMNVVAMEDAYNKQEGGIGLTIDDYIAFKDAGIIAPRQDRTSGMVFQSDITSVSPSANPSLVDAKRRYMGDFIIDSLADIGKRFEKKLNTPTQRRAFLANVNGFLDSLKSASQPDSSRIEDFAVKDETTTAQRGLGFQILSVKVRLYASMDYIVFRLSVGTSVDVSELQ